MPTNIDSIRWNAWPEGTVKVEEGLITALKQGEGRIVCSAETISSQCCVLVLPWLNKMSLSEQILKNGLSLRAGEEYALDVKVSPENAIDSGNYSIKSDNLLVANIVGQKIIGVDSGTATVTGRKFQWQLQKFFQSHSQKLKNKE